MFEKKIWLLICLVLSMAMHMANAQGSGSGEMEAGLEEGSAALDETPAEEASGEEATSEDTASEEDAVPEAEGEGAPEEDGAAPEEGEITEAEVDDADPEVDGSGEGANGIGDESFSAEGSGADATAEEGEAEAEAEGGAEELAATLFQCNMDGMDEKVAECMSSLDERVGTLEQATLSGEGGGLEEQITLVLVKKGVIDCDNNTQCADDRACIDSYQEPGRKLCERPCDRTQCSVPYSECVATNHEAECVCKEGFHGNGTKACFPEGFEEEANGKSYKMFDDAYVEFDNATDHCNELGARLPVLDSAETIKIIMAYLEESNFTVFEQWDRSSRRIWLGLTLDRGSGLTWVDGARVISYPASSRLFVWESRRMLSQEVSYADNSRHYALYIDGDLAKLPGGGRKGAAVLCELIPSQIREPAQQNPYQNYNTDPRYQQYGPQQPSYPSDGGYSPYAQRPGY
ncbi:uncharacterized protein LOC131887293 isoform X2 [Tigriopus californicus]|uniref:uncharacterized protein LOC131887293 isoform X2 n=1 Tax=Tigriopus californicus TaxID=6832 RepID=UPI0027D9DAEA|nr:uncharacterized protein LOC131887293 isoform X2 [Tigriopus californicus]|eukprot:TCALIF_11933-PA protein Name:"Protein of unknown function" AED:0.00 eAED:0.00 QI:130/1/1/1/0.71/0.75/8/138/459